MVNYERDKGYLVVGQKSTGESGATTGGSGAITKEICASSRKESKTEEEDREARK